MNIIDAIKSGKPFKRKNTNHYFVRRDGSGIVLRDGRYEPDTTCYVLTANDLLADDWVLEEKQVTITESEYDEIIKNFMEFHHKVCAPPHETVISLLVRHIKGNLFD